ncbi:MAG: GGDEF domain-containing protein [Phyllobacteriaceae bacterium]|nr:GGDEF domain-containing protein [Phyllobacteriaceae bacterium]
MRFLTWTLQLASRRNIRSRSDLWRYVARMTLYIGALTALVTVVQMHGRALTDVVVIATVAFAATAVLSIPITWEFGRMYLDLWDATQSLHRLARTDLQTGLLNNRTFVHQVEERLASGRRVALLLADLDRFKAINDRHGHPIGDEVIAAVGTVIRDLFGEGMIFGRMGGEEFAVAIECPFGESKAAREICDRWAEELRRRVAELRIEGAGEEIAPTVSIGIARSNGDDGFSGLYARADKALYMAKSAGRNRIVDEGHVEFVGAIRRLEIEAGSMRGAAEAVAVI